MMSVQQRVRAGALAVLVIATVTSGFADVPRGFSFQGRLAGYNDEVVGLTVRLWDASSAGNQLFSETHSGVALQNGIFAIRIGSVSGGVPTSAVIHPVWVGLAVDGEAELTPRTRLSSVPFAYAALAADQLVIPDTFTPAAIVEPDGDVLFEDRVRIGAAGDGAGVVGVRNTAGTQTVKLDGEETGDAGGFIEISNGAATNTVTVLLDGNASNDGRVDLYDENGVDSIRLHSDLQNDAPEVSLFTDASGQNRETVQISGNFDADSEGAGELRLRRVDASQTAVTTVQLAATHDNALGDPVSGGFLQMNYVDGSPVFTVKAGAGTSALAPANMELRDIGANANKRFTVSPASMSFYDVNNNLTISLGGVSGTASFDGDVSVGTLTITGGSDLSEQFDIRAASGVVEPGLVVCIDPPNPGKLVVSATPYDRSVAGVVSGAGGVNTGMMMGQSGTLADGKHPVALTGRVWVQCDATDAAIEPGDLLTTSGTPGHAMRVADHSRAHGAIIGKAMTSLAAGERGLVLVLVNLQ